jgi:hypothetical protein
VGGGGQGAVVSDEIESVAYDSRAQPDRGYAVRAQYLKKPNDGDALIEIFKDGAVIRSFKYPAYRIWNIAAHFSDIVDGEIEKHDGGYRAADWNGLTPQGDPEPLL